MTIKDLFTGRGLRLKERPVRKLGVMIIVATIPTGIIGVLFNSYFEKMYSSLIAIGIGLIITGFIMFFAEKMGSAKKGIEKMNFRNAIFIGVLQGIAICPGISRSGSTLVGGLSTGSVSYTHLEIRLSLPDDVQQARWVKDEKDRILGEAKAEYEKIIVEAKKQAEYLVESDDITLKAQKLGEQIVKNAEEHARVLKMRTYDYVDKMLFDMQSKMEDMNLKYFGEMYSNCLLYTSRCV